MFKLQKLDDKNMYESMIKDQKYCSSLALQLGDVSFYSGNLKQTYKNIYVKAALKLQAMSIKQKRAVTFPL